MKVEGSVGLVTGGASGLGAGVARSLLERGGRVAVLDQNLEGAGTLVDQFEGSVTCHKCDVTDTEQVETSVSAAVEAHGRLDLLVSCAGISFGKRVISRDGEPHSLDHFKKHIDINLVGLFDVVRHVVAAMARELALDAAYPHRDSTDRRAMLSASPTECADTRLSRAARLGLQARVRRLRYTP